MTIVKDHFVFIHQVGDHLVSAMLLFECTMWLFCFVNLELEDFIREHDSREKRKNLFKKWNKRSTHLEGSAPKDTPAWAVWKQQTSSPEVVLCIYLNHLWMWNFVDYTCYIASSREWASAGFLTFWSMYMWSNYIVLKFSTITESKSSTPISEVQ